MVYTNNHEKLFPKRVGIVTILLLLSPSMSRISSINSFDHEPKKMKLNAMPSNPKFLFVDNKVFPAAASPLKNMEKDIRAAHDIFFIKKTRFKIGVYIST